MTSFADARRQFQQNWESWDTSRDSQIDSKDVMSFDKNGDGVLDMNEVETLAEQLSSQVTIPFPLTIASGAHRLPYISDGLQQLVA